MKKLFLFATVLLASAGVFAQAKKAEEVVKFKELTYDFGKIKQGSPVTHEFAFTNISNSPVIIESAVPSCGCTTPVKPEGAIGKGKDDKITAGFNAAAAGPFNKSITIKVAGVDQPLQLKITGEVLTVDAYTKYEATKSNKSGR
jgi:opacity protein-like surface antigen